MFPCCCVMAAGWSLACARAIYHLGSSNQKENTNYRLGGDSPQVDIHRVRTTNGENVAISGTGIKIDRYSKRPACVFLKF